MRVVRTSGQFERDLKLAKKRGLNIQKLWRVVDLLARGEPLEARHRRHKLAGDWKGCFECHVAPDWLLIWYDFPDAIELARTGTHSDLFRK
jgi:mRNA interferase YafQ